MKCKLWSEQDDYKLWSLRSKPTYQFVRYHISIVSIGTGYTIAILDTGGKVWFRTRKERPTTIDHIAAHSR